MSDENQLTKMALANFKLQSMMRFMEGIKDAGCIRVMLTDEVTQTIKKDTALFNMMTHLFYQELMQLETDYVEALKSELARMQADG